MGWRQFAAALAAVLFVPTSLPAFVLKDPVARRPGGEYTVNTQISHSTLGTVSPSGTDWNDGFVDALNSWNNAAGLGGLVDLNANAGVFEDPCDMTGNGVHGVGFSDKFCGVDWGGMTLAIARTNFSLGGLITEGNIVFRDDMTTNWDIVAGAQGVFDDFRRVAVHEIGHLVGLDHPPGSNAIMFASVQDNVEVPQADDIAGIEALYDLTCPTLIAAGTETINGSLDATDCLADTDLGLLLPGGLGECVNQLSFQADSFVDLYQVSLPSGASLDVTMSSPPFPMGGFNPTVQVFNTALNSELGCDWDSAGGTGANLSLPLAPGDYIVAARSILLGEGTDYTLTIAPEPGGGALATGALFALGALRRRLV